MRSSSRKAVVARRSAAAALCVGTQRMFVASSTQTSNSHCKFVTDPNLTREGRQGNLPCLALPKLVEP